MSQQQSQKSKSVSSVPFYKNPRTLGIIAAVVVLLIIIIVVISKLVMKKPASPSDSPSNSPSPEAQSTDSGSSNGQPQSMDQNQQAPPGLIKYTWTLNNMTGQTLGLVSLFDNTGHSSVVNELTTTTPNTYDISFLANQNPQVMVKSGQSTISTDAQGNPIPLPQPGTYNITGSTGNYKFTLIPPPSAMMPNTSMKPSRMPR